MWLPSRVALLIGTSKGLVAQNRALIRQTRHRVARARRRLDPAFAIVGGSGASERTLRDTVRALLVSGALRRIDGTAAAGRGPGGLCAVCGDAVLPEELGYQVHGDGDGTTVAHVPCFLAWDEESANTLTKE